MVRKIAIGFGALIVLLIGVAFVLPSTVHVERSAVIKASPEEVFSIVNDLTRFNEWSAWSEQDPDMKQTLDGPPTGVGAKMSWTSHKLGNGSQMIVESEPFKHIKTKLDFGGSGPSFATFTLDPVEGGTRIVWALDTEVGMNPVGRYFGLVMDSLVGKDYERGLVKLKALVESAADAATREALADPGTGAMPPDIYTPVAADPSKGPEVVTLEARPVIKTQGSAPASEDAAISGALGGAFQKILTFAEANALEVGGAAPTAVTISHENGVWTFEAAMPLLAKPASIATEAEGVEIGQSYAGKAVKVTHKGPYSSLKASYERLHAYTKENKLKEKGLAWEEYVGDPAETGDEALLTNVYIAVE
jgi:effector-binding domain-containing protein/uncharacterized protein YndB with AHSA1/START domain